MDGPYKEAQDREHGINRLGLGGLQGAQEAVAGYKTGCEVGPMAMERAPLTIGWAVKQLHNGSRVRRRGWNGRGMWLRLVPGSFGRLPYVEMLTAQGDIVPWLCSHTDLLATDWELAE